MAFMAFEIKSDFWFDSYSINLLCLHPVKALSHALMLAFLVFLAFIGLLGEKVTFDFKPRASIYYVTMLF